MRFILVDRIHELDPGKQIIASKTLPAHEELFRDHFPGFPVVPGVLLTEMMAQAAGKCLDAEGTHPGRAMLGKINGAKFREWVRPGQEIFLHATITLDRATYATADCFAEVDGRKVSSAELFFVFAPHGQFAPGYEDEVLKAYWKANPALQPKETR
jgi:3-hydroxyacyl-[acyl-carrier-protein] dehydratase